jgi:hypothetical protein
MSRSEVLFHLFELLNYTKRINADDLNGTHGELYNKIMDRYEMLYNRKTCHVYAKQCAIIGVLSDYLVENVEKIDEPTCIKCGGCKKFTGR